ncbi:MAG: hypothetical protein HY645_03030 [Acidobacteria bacterium]|nr:hypothetical protein [Acidobacteriota bacterium]
MVDQNLSWLERQVLLQLAQGHPTHHITQTFSMTVNEYRSVVDGLQKKFQARSLQEAIVLAYESGFIRL